MRRILRKIAVGDVDERIAANVNRICCANIRSGISFAVADAHRHWTDVTEEEALRLFKQRST